MDSNAKHGTKLIQDDPHSISKNGEYLREVIRNNELIVCNGSTLCEGLITRERTTINGTEQSIIDFVIICHDLFSYLSKMVIDGQNSSERHLRKDGKSIVKRSDHKLLVCQFNQNISNEISSQFKKGGVKSEFFDFRDQEGWKKFKELTSK